MVGYFLRWTLTIMKLNEDVEVRLNRNMKQDDSSRSNDASADLAGS